VCILCGKINQKSKSESGQLGYQIVGIHYHI
jgi:hypothetical protein